MEENSKNPYVVSVEDSFDSSDCSVFESNLEKWSGIERERLAAKGKDDRFFVYADPDINEGIIYGGDYTMKFNRDECVIDLVINSEEDSLIWDDVVDKVPARFAAVFGKPETFLYRISSNTSEKKEFYYFDPTYDEGGSLLPTSIDELNPLGAWRAEYFDELIC